MSVAGWSFWLTIIGSLLSIFGFAFTWIQLQQTKSVAEATRDQTKKIIGSLDRFDAAQEIIKASTHIGAARDSFAARSWVECSENCEVAMKSLSKTKQFIKDTNANLADKVEKPLNYLRKLCERIDRKEMDNIDDDNFAKMKSSLRNHEQSISEVLSALQKDSLNV